MTTSSWLRRLLLWLGAALLVFLAVVVWVCYTGYRILEQAGCSSSINVVSTQLLLCHQLHGAFPPAYRATEDDKLKHSWRVRLDALARRHAEPDRRYNFDRAWDSSWNLAFASEPPKYSFACPAISGKDATTANYFAVVGDDTVFPPVGSVSLSSVTDGPENTVMILELPWTDVSWNEPRDVDLDELKAMFDKQGGIAKGCPHRNGPVLLFADLKECRLKKKLPWSTFRGLLTKSGGEKTTRQDLIDQGYLAGPLE